jgi:predicted Na+-dependent transporter
MEIYRGYYHGFIKPFLEWVYANQISSFVDVIGDIGFVVLLPFLFACAIKYLLKG